MLELHLLRHAKTTQDPAAESDFARWLIERGVLDAWLMGGWLGERGLAPDLALVSTARRARETRDLVLPRLGWRGPQQERDDLYLAAAGDLLRIIRATPEEVRRLLVIGHNDGLHDLARSLAGAGDGRSLVALQAGLPTAGYVALMFDVSAWSAVAAGTGRLDVFMTPRRLRGEPD